MKNTYTEKEVGDNIMSILAYVKKFGHSVTVKTNDTVDIEIVAKPKKKLGLSSKLLKLAGIWKDRAETNDSVKYGRLLREKASKRYSTK